MKMHHLKIIVGMIIIITHFFLIFFAMFFLRSDLGGDEMVAVVGMLIPVTASFVTAIVKDGLLNPHKVQRRGNEKTLNFWFIFISIFFPIMLFAYHFTVMLLFHGQNIDNINAYIASGEGVVGVYVGFIVGKIY